MAKLQIKTKSNAAELSSSEDVHSGYFSEMIFVECPEISVICFKILTDGYHRIDQKYILLILNNPLKNDNYG
jgi:hypothetical protein